MGCQFAKLDWGGLLDARAEMYIVVVAEMATKDARGKTSALPCWPLVLWSCWSLKPASSIFERRHRSFEGGLPRRRRGSSAQDAALAGPDKRFAFLQISPKPLVAYASQRSHIWLLGCFAGIILNFSTAKPNKPRTCKKGRHD